MAGRGINEAKNTLQLFLRSLPMNCTFNVIGFGTHTEELFSESRHYDKDSLKQVLRDICRDKLGYYTC